MNIVVIGMGRIGCVTAGCLAQTEHNVFGIDIDKDVISSLSNGELPFYEPNLNELIHDIDGFDITYSDITYSKIENADVTFICTPSQNVLDAIHEASRYTSNLICIRSTVPPGTTEQIDVDNNIAINPEFLSEGTAVNDFLNPDKVVFGVNRDNDFKTLYDAYYPLLAPSQYNNYPARTTPTEAEMIKYANNTMLASKLSTINEIGNICRKLNIDAREVLNVVGQDERISEEYMNPGIGWGGSCFKKDLNTLSEVARNNQYDPTLIDTVIDVNMRQIIRTIWLLSNHINCNDKIAILGLAFKSGTDDTRESRGVKIGKKLSDMGLTVTGYDPQVTEHFDGIDVKLTPEDALTNCDAAVIAAGWGEFSSIDYNCMNSKVIIDGRGINIEDDLDVYEGVCW